MRRESPPCRSRELLQVESKAFTFGGVVDCRSSVFQGLLQEQRFIREKQTCSSLVPPMAQKFFEFLLTRGDNVRGVNGEFEKLEDSAQCDRSYPSQNAPHVKTRRSKSESDASKLSITSSEPT